MANVNNLENRLIQIIEQNEPVAIALTGEWGIGKTHFWQSFYKSNHQNLKQYVDKYAYVSLFGIDSLETLKYEIAIQSHDTIQQKNHLSKVKSLFTDLFKHVSLPKIESNGFSMAISQSMVNTLIGNMVKNTLICIDDFERKSDKLAVKDIMGVINDLREQKNCKVVVILHSDKLNSEFAEYKEKVFDDILYFDDNIDLLKEIINNDEIFDIYESFYQKVKIKNLRFYKKVHNAYLKLVELDKNFSLTSKKYILKNLLVIKLVQNFEIKLEYGKENKEKNEFKVHTDLFFKENKKNVDTQEKLNAFNKYLNDFMSFESLRENDWREVILRDIIGCEKDETRINILSQDNTLTEKRLKNDEEYLKLKEELYSLLPKQNFVERFNSCILDRLKINGLYIKSFQDWYKDFLILEKADAELAQKFMCQVLNRLKLFLSLRKEKIALTEIPFVQENIYYGEMRKLMEEHNKKIKQMEDENTIIKTKQIANILANGWAGVVRQEEYIKAINELDDKQIEEILWEYCSDKDRKKVIKAIIEENKTDKIRERLIELLKNKGEENEGYDLAISIFLEKTKNLTQFPE